MNSLKEFAWKGKFKNVKAYGRVSKNERFPLDLYIFTRYTDLIFDSGELPFIYKIT